MCTGRGRASLRTLSAACHRRPRRLAGAAGGPSSLAGLQPPGLSGYLGPVGGPSPSLSAKARHAPRSRSTLRTVTLCTTSASRSRRLRLRSAHTAASRRRRAAAGPGPRPADFGAAGGGTQSQLGPAASEWKPAQWGGGPRRRLVLPVQGGLTLAASELQVQACAPQCQCRRV